MPAIRNVSPLGALDVPLLGRHVDAGEEVDVTADQAAVLLAQADNFAPADKAATKISATVLAPAETAAEEPPVTPPVVDDPAPAPTPEPDAAGAPDATEGAA